MRYATRGMLVLLIVGCAGGLGSAVKGGPKPSWVDAGAGPARGFEGKLTAVGILQRRPEAGADVLVAELDAAARTALVKKLSVTVSAELSASQSSVDGVESSSVESRTREVVAGFDLQGVEIAGRWHDESAGVLYALAVMDKSAASARLVAQIAESDRQAEEALSGAESALREGNSSAALFGFVRARSEVDRARQSAVLYRAINGSNPGGVPSSARYDARAGELLGGLRLAIIEGDGQRADEGKGLAQPVVLEATLTYKGAQTPLAGLPLRAELPGGRVDSPPATGADGRARIDVLDVGRFAADERTLSARVDWEGLARLAGADLSRGVPGWLAARPPVEAPARIFKRSRESLRVMVKIFERIDDAETSGESQVQSAVEQALVGAKVRVQDARGLVDLVGGEERLARLGDDELKASARGLADVLVIGTAVSRYSSNFGKNSVWHRARGTIRAIDLGTGRVVANVDLEVKGARPGLGNDKAGKAALSTLSEQIAGKISDEVLRGLGF